MKERRRSDVIEWRRRGELLAKGSEPGVEVGDDGLGGDGFGHVLAGQEPITQSNAIGPYGAGANVEFFLRSFEGAFAQFQLLGGGPNLPGFAWSIFQNP